MATVMQQIADLSGAVYDLTAERDALREQVAALTPTAEQRKRRELAELAFAYVDAEWAWMGADEDTAALHDAMSAARAAYIAARNAARGAE